MALQILTIVHVIISLLGIASGFAIMAAMLRGNPRHPWTGFFLAMTLATSLTGFLFPYDKGFTPALGFGVISTIILALALYALYKRQLAGGWRKTYIICALFAQYLNVFVLVVQMFLKIPALKALAPTQSEPPFGIAQGLVLIGFLATGFLSLRRKPQPA
ncbi:hypothetical protein [Haloferula sp. BvORR071]|uniref:hypothetical protein n=1 Tax=Haloferula sp. BvORR071 TaxID=1396141 RepID=UPI0005562F47|nr:hypothetical protein [Haloferula sp. BvORR071]